MKLLSRVGVDYAQKEVNHLWTAIEQLRLKRN